MKIGVPKEIKSFENRVALTPAGVAQLVEKGHDVYIEAGAGVGSGFLDDDYRKMGAVIETDAANVWDVDMVFKVKEPLESEYQYFRKDLIIFTYLHLANDEKLTRELLETGTIGLAYETMSLNGKLPLLTPMSEVAGRYAVQVGSQLLEKQYGGKGILLGSVPGVPVGKVVIIGGGVVGINAAKIAIGFGAQVTIIDLNPTRLAELADIFGNQVETIMSNPANIAEQVKDADIVIGSVLIPGAKAPVLVTEEMVKSMEAGSVIIDIAVDQGGNFETIDHATTHEDPYYIKHDVLHYAVANIPGAVPRTSTLALTNVTLRYAMLVADNGLVQAAKSNSTILTGINTYQGKMTNKAVAESFNLDYTDIENLLK
ncbi:alanine dehydrogenase [Fundicoccus culcitae]|uniref:Alanine dehydrogenase n=1 Tax=Fundicoccus culcitae TaxID=2969821 RepID=A0ABY5PAF6_9LACT|nr:alanine dehydrogenase [Fundicoccus culcitae]UUX35445.1 alanine dehydrogenase [Fundicoccus culcitae]